MRIEDAEPSRGSAGVGKVYEHPALFSHFWAVYNHINRLLQILTLVMTTEKYFLMKLKKSTVGLSLIFPIARDFSQSVILFMSANDDMMQMKMGF